VEVTIPKKGDQDGERERPHSERNGPKHQQRLAQLSKGQAVMLFVDADNIVTEVASVHDDKR